MISFIIALLALVTGYFIYGSFVEKTFTVDTKRETPCYTMADGVDYTPMPAWRVFLVQFLNIAGTGPIFGAIQGILFGPAAYFWIVLGCIFGGAVHDYMSGMICVRSNGASLPELIGDQLGNVARVGMRLLSFVLLVLVGTVFATTPAGLLGSMTSDACIGGIALNVTFWTILIFAYYILATLLPIDKLIGKVYPLFGIALLLMAAGMLWGIITEAGSVPEITEAFANHNPGKAIPLFPGLCITIACGAVSGFHGTQSPMMARCLTNEKYGRPVFYGAMITEGIVALIWAAAAIKFADSLGTAGNTPYEKLLNLMTENGAHGVNPALLVNQVCHSWLGTAGAILAVLGVVAAPITSGDTAFRSARLIAADFLKIKQTKIITRLFFCLPIFAVSAALMFVDFTVIWRYFAWTNQTLAAFTLWAVTIWLLRQGKCYWIGLVPAVWMTMVCATYIMIAPEGFHLGETFSYAFGILVTVIATGVFYYAKNNIKS